jgi:DNA-binding MarR family transcriptional regulator
MKRTNQIGISSARVKSTPGPILRRPRRAPVQRILERAEVKTLTGAHLKALLCVAMSPGLSTLRIARRAGLHVITARRAVRELCARGLMQSDADGKWECIT